MTGRSHALVAVASATLVHLHVARLALNPIEAILTIIAAIVGGLLPDIDSGMSAIRQATGTARTWWGGRILDWLIVRILPHRGITHSLMAWGMVSSLVLWLFAHSLAGPAVALTTGYLSHLIADALTPEGVPLLAPVTWRRIGLPRLVAITTGSWTESAAVAVLWLWVGVTWR